MILRYQDGILDLITEIGPGELEALEHGHPFFVRLQEGDWQQCYSFGAGGVPVWEAIPEGDQWPDPRPTIN